MTKGSSGTLIAGLGATLVFAAAMVGGIAPLMDTTRTSGDCQAPFRAHASRIASSCAIAAVDDLDRQPLEDAKSQLLKLGLVSPREMAIVKVDWCPSIPRSFAPTNTAVVLNPALASSPAELVATLGYEIQHLRQWHHLGFDAYACRVSQGMVAARTKERLGPLEAEALAFERQVRATWTRDLRPATHAAVAQDACTKPVRGVCQMTPVGLGACRCATWTGPVPP